jgi:hypothetical protein
MSVKRPLKRLNQVLPLVKLIPDTKGKLIESLTGPAYAGPVI